MPEIDESARTFVAGQMGSNDWLVIFAISEDAGGKARVSEFLAAHSIVVEESSPTFNDVTADNVAATTGTVGDLEVSTSIKVSEDGSLIESVLLREVSVAPSDITAGSSETVNVTVTGAATTMYLSGAALTGALPDGLTMQAWISAADQVSFKFHNNSSGTITGAIYTARLTLMSAGTP